MLLRRPTRGDAGEFTRAMRASAALHQGWVSPPSDRSAYSAYLHRLRSPQHDGFLVCLREAGAIAGVVNVNNIIRGALQGASLGYFAVAEHAGRGLMSEGLRLTLHIAFGPLGLHRVEADIQPDNARSIALVERLGFKLEGFSPRYLRVAGQWRDHQHWALAVEDWSERGGRAES